VDAKYGEAYRELFEKHWWWRSRSELIVDKLRQMQPEAGWNRILDIGCGDGLLFDRLAEFGEVEGIEPSEDLVSPKNPHRARIYIRPFDESFQPGKKYSLILLLDVVEHLTDPVGALRHALSLLEPRGLIFITVPAFMSLWTNHDNLNHHRVRYTKSSFSEVAKKADFNIQEERYLYHWTFPIKFGVRILERISRAAPEAPKLSAAWVNETLFWMSRLEQKTVSLLSMPFGSSLLVLGGHKGVL
jgi:2-polyprenyl-3-methyl-5-hydroxy-6-metoxy-1,4-benzoquinol methylase